MFHIVFIGVGVYLFCGLIALGFYKVKEKKNPNKYISSWISYPLTILFWWIVLKEWIQDNIVARTDWRYEIAKLNNKVEYVKIKNEIK